MRRTCLTLCAATLLVVAAAGQQIPVDSLRATWTDTTLSTRQRVPALARWMERDSTLSVQQATLFVVPNGTDTNDARYVRQRGVAALARTAMYNHSNRTTKALPAANEALRWVQRGGNVLDIALAHTYFGIQFAKIGLTGEAVQHQMLALEGYERFKDTLGQYNTNNGLAFSFSTQALSAQALAYYKRNLALVRHRQPKEAVDMMLRVAGEYKAMDDRTAAMAWLDSATAVIRNEGGTDAERMVNWLRGDMLLDDGDCAAALTDLRLSMEAIDTNPANPAGKSWIRSRIAMAHLCAKQYPAALEMASAGLAIAQEHDLLKEELDNLFPLASAYEGLGRAVEALRYFKRYHALSASLINTEAASRLTDAALTLDFQKEQLADSLLTVQRERDAEVSLSKERARRNLLLIAGLVALVFGSISYRQRRKTQKALKRSDELLLNILPEEVAEELKTKGHADAKHFDKVTILFTDFKGFTAATEKLSPQELVEELNTCFKAFDGIITAHGIEKIKTIGDAYMCAGGLPVPSSSTPAGVVQAALEMQAFMDARKKERDAQGKPAFEMRVGIHTGPVVAGIVGVKKFAYDIWGDTVNIASRMESSGEVAQVNISESTYALVKDEPGLTFTPRGKVQAKGKGEMEMYFVRP
jgi:class 3 adenylate cyclase